MNSATAHHPPDRAGAPARGGPAPNEEPELNNERDIPTEADDAEVVEAPAGRSAAELGRAVADKESVAGEEDPGAALDASGDPP